MIDSPDCGPRMIELGRQTRPQLQLARVPGNVRLLQRKLRCLLIKRLKSTTDHDDDAISSYSMKNYEFCYGIIESNMRAIGRETIVLRTSSYLNATLH